MSADGDNIWANDNDDAGTTTVIGEVDDDKYDINNQSAEKKHEWFFIIISTNSQNILKIKRTKFDYFKKLSYCAYLLCVIRRIINLSFYKII